MTYKLLLTALAVLLCAGLASPPALDYVLTPIVRDGELQSVQVDLRFLGEADGETGLRLPQSWGGQEELWRGIQSLAVVSGAELREGEGPGRRLLSHRPNAPIHVRYLVVQDWSGAPNAEQGNTYRPVIQPSYFHLIGEASLVLPEHVSHAARARFRVRGLPWGWRFASDLQHRGLTVGELLSSVAVGGDFRVLRDARSGVRVAIRGEWSFTDAEFLDRAARILSAQRHFWGDGPSPYLVTVLQLEAPNRGWLSIGGTGLDDAFAFFATPNAEAEPITRTLAHEGLHTWIPGEIGGAPDQDEGEAAQYWLSEGFTDFYAGRVLVRDGAWTPAQFAADLNEMLLAYAQSPVRAAPNARVVADFWNDQDVQRLPYQRGRLLGLIWDARLRALGHNLDDVVLAMRDRARRGNSPKAVELFPAAAASLGLDVSQDLALYVEEGRPISLPADLFAPCGRVITREAPVFDRGFQFEVGEDDGAVVITQVDPELPAYAAGMRAGMRILRREAGEIGNAEREIVYVVRDGGQERTIRYMPHGRGTFTMQRFELAEALEGETLARCIAVLGGE